MALTNKLTAIGDAIRNKNGSTSKLTLDGMVTAINDMADVTIDGVKVAKPLSLTKYVTDVNKSTLPGSYPGCAVVYNDEIHLVGGGYYNDETLLTNHYKWNGSSWVKVGALPQSMPSSLSLIFNKDIHVLCYSYHYKWNGVAWTSVSNAPYSIRANSSFVVEYNNAIHLFGTYQDGDSYYPKYHHKWDGSSWTKLPATPISFTYGTGVAYKGDIHVMHNTNHYKWNGSVWTLISDSIPVSSNQGRAIVINDEIHLFEGEVHCKYDGTSWETVGTLPYVFNQGAAVVCKNDMHILGGDYQSPDRSRNHYIIQYTIYRKAV